MELEENVKRKSERLPSPREKIKLISRVGVSSEVRKFSSNIEIAEKDLVDLTKKHKDSNKALFLNKNAIKRKRNATQTFKSKHFSKH